MVTGKQYGLDRWEVALFVGPDGNVLIFFVDIKCLSEGNRSTATSCLCNNLVIERRFQETSGMGACPAYTTT